MQREELLLKLGNRFKNVRLEKGISQTELAYSIGKDQQSIQRLESGKINPSYLYMLEVCNGLEISIQEIFS